MIQIFGMCGTYTDTVQGDLRLPFPVPGCVVRPKHRVLAVTCFTRSKVMPSGTKWQTHTYNGRVTNFCLIKMEGNAILPSFPNIPLHIP